DKLRVLSVRREVARSGLGRFAAFGPPTRNFSEIVLRSLAPQVCLSARADPEDREAVEGTGRHLCRCAEPGRSDRRACRQAVSDHQD
ncbi:MAG: hypothetical protein VX152_12200, partial [Pseudomonadota bacterium]|nr:hypothetical protein [Pseudomonadota bacterium]